MINYYFDEQRQFSIDRGDLIKRMKGKSEQTMHNLIRCLYRPIASRQTIGLMR